MRRHALVAPMALIALASCTAQAAQYVCTAHTAYDDEAATGELSAYPDQSAFRGRVFMVDTVSGIVHGESVIPKRKYRVVYAGDDSSGAKLVFEAGGDIDVLYLKTFASGLVTPFLYVDAVSRVTGTCRKAA